MEQNGKSWLITQRSRVQIPPPHLNDCGQEGGIPDRAAEIAPEAFRAGMMSVLEELEGLPSGGSIEEAVKTAEVPVFPARVTRTSAVIIASGSPFIRTDQQRKIPVSDQGREIAQRKG